MGKVWGIDTVAKNASTSFYGNIVSLAESPKKEGLLYVGTDDGLVQVTEDGGANWRKIDRFPGVPENTYVSNLTASLHDAGTVYAAFDNHKMGDFKPYLLKSTDRGRTWTSIAGDLPKNGPVYAVAEDHVESGPALRGHRVRPVLLARRRQEVDPAQGRPAHHRSARHRHPAAGERPRARRPSAAASTSSTTTRRCGSSKPTRWTRSW